MNDRLVALQGTQREWQTVFIIGAAVYIFGWLVFVIFSNADVQPWATDTTDEQQTNNGRSTDEQQPNNGRSTDEQQTIGPSSITHKTKSTWNSESQIVGICYAALEIDNYGYSNGHCPDISCDDSREGMGRKNSIVYE